MDVQADQPAYCCRSTSVYNVTTVYILEKFGGSSTGQGKFVVCSYFQVSTNTAEANLMNTEEM